MKGTYEFTVPNGDYDYDAKTDTFVWKDLVFTETHWKQVKEVVKDYVSDDVPFTMIFMPEGRDL
jgi:hypothetical protein